MRALLLGLAALVALPALAAEWFSYDNARYGYRIEVPAGFVGGPELDNGDGRSFRDGASRLSVWGGEIAGQSFESAVRAAAGSISAEGWALIDETVTPSWASLSGTRGQRILQQRMIALCDGRYAAFRIEYSAVEMGALDRVVNRMAQSLRPTEGGEC